MSVKSASGNIAYAFGQETPEFVVPLAVGLPLTLTNALQALGFVNADTSYIYKVDLLGVKQVRLTGVVKTVSASVNSPKLQLKAHTAFSTTPGDYGNLGSSSVEFSMFTGAADGDSGWIDLAATYRINSCYLALMNIGGDGAADPVVNNVMLHCR